MRGPAHPGLGPQNAAMFASILNRIPFKNSDSLIAFSGLDPRPADSGQRRGRRRLSKRGPGLMRRLIYLAASAACRTKAGRPIFAALRARGFSTTLALVILSRKLLRTAFAVCKSGKPFDIAQFAAPNAC
ncbi:transposase [Burkholderia gladioli]|uniref:transposase n=1 Tax=Burkholderia gladioli TaxID=28095 RepID=UPI003C7B06F5